MLRIGLTGGIGSGKSTVAKIFEVLGIPVYYADEAARKLMNEEPLKQQIIDHFGAQSYKDGQLDRSFLAGVVFRQKEKLEWLNSLTHPAVLRDSEAWLEKQTAPYTIREAALVFESGIHHYLDGVIGVSAPKDLRIKRVMKRDGSELEEVERRIENQMDETQKMSLCNFVIFNDEKQLLLPQVLALHSKLCQGI